jgi:hypothetical protein
MQSLEFWFNCWRHVHHNSSLFYVGYSDARGHYYLQVKYSGPISFSYVYEECICRLAHVMKVEVYVKIR